MKESTWLCAVLLTLGAASVWAQPGPQGGGGPDGPPEIGDNPTPGQGPGSGQGQGGPGMAGPQAGRRRSDGGWATGGPGGLPQAVTAAQEKELVDFLKTNEPKSAE